MKKKEIDINELKNIQLMMLADIDGFCTANDINYSLAYGTLLGSIRHQGYIPWDDDIDIMMPRKDYEKFIGQYVSEFYKVIDVNNNINYSLPFAKIHDTRTVMQEFVDNDSSFGVYIDVFPIDNVPDSRFKEFIQFSLKSILNVIHNIKNVKIAPKRGFIKNSILFLGHVVLLPYPLHSCAVSMDNLSKLFSNTKTKRSAIIAPANNSKGWINQCDVFTNYQRTKFENIDVSIITRYDELLTSIYGDYMKLPPIEKQVSHHNFKAWWK